ncbi:hypothetical protein Pmar_PMAR008518 [Perkinsus marinus ATCC 50983]|uniref:Uncharacterized protein n=1 Tax=Perkinsus marinus (strain ATCC 50983 / TXsc) TaxID=423536 RepID=C5M1M4_PERM5|nr:hypothetical protein Pmar_PMAR008518 [Perkinsus marinus ATCC 50983]EEQ97117.1 hypothetical protein Pmar_PMAR008518 [Perkinsus marinus ATCC 50983]|eukprot:XP_002764400.1 hypothetical protein Pmar_PMAR008518 [Perkinsus marinus ATCC 50983]
MPEFGNKCSLVSAVRKGLELQSMENQCKWLPETYILLKILDRKTALEYLKGLEKGRPSKAVIQRYISDPLLLDGCKCDLRMFLLMTRTEPLKVLMASAYCPTNHDRHILLVDMYGAL